MLYVPELEEREELENVFFLVAVGRGKERLMDPRDVWSECGKCSELLENGGRSWMKGWNNFWLNFFKNKIIDEDFRKI